jgi:hypothetical protein
LLEFRGRSDDRIKIRGNRVELPDIERIFESLPGIERAAALAVTRENREPLLVAFVVKKDEASWTAPRLRHAVAASLSPHMVPSKIVFLDTIPYNRGNKIDRAALREKFSSTARAYGREQPRTETEFFLADIWSEVLDLADIGRSDDFFSLGGDSLSGSIVAARIHAALGIELTIGEIADHPTVSALAKLVDDWHHAKVPGLPPLVPFPRGSSMPMSFFQERIWSHSLQDRASWTLTRTYRIIGPLDVDILKECLSHLIERHEILRTTFGLVDESPSQIIHAASPLDFSFVDLIDTVDAEHQAETIFREADSQGIDLGALPISRYVLIRVARDNYRLARIFNHIISDGAASEILNTELSILYEARLQGIEPPLPKQQRLQYADYAAWQRQFIGPGSSYFKETVGWWKERFSIPLPVTELPFKRLTPRPKLDPSEGVLRWQLEEDVEKRLDQLAHRGNATHFSVRLAAFAALIADVTANSTVIIGTNCVSRNRAETQGIVGPFVSTVPLVFSYDASMTFLEWLKIVRDRAFETTKRSELPQEDINLQLRAAGIKPPEIRVIFAMSADHSVQRFGNLDFSEEFWGVGKMPWGCTFYVEGQTKKSSWVKFDARVYDPCGMRMMLDRYIRLLEAAARAPGSPIGELLAMTGGRPLRWTCANYVATFRESLRARLKKQCY